MQENIIDIFATLHRRKGHAGRQDDQEISAAKKESFKPKFHTQLLPHIMDTLNHK